MMKLESQKSQTSGINGSSGASIVVRPAEPDDYSSARNVQWSAGWKDAPERHRYWPTHEEEWVNRHHFREFVAEVDGVVAARIGLEAYCQPFAELVNLCVLPEYRRHGLGQMLTVAGQKLAAEMGFTILFLQTEMDNYSAHRLYAAQGWVPTAHGKMLRMVKLLDYPLVANFKRNHPLYQYRCYAEPDVTNTWNMEWYAYVTEDSLKLILESGASRSDSGGIAPAIAGLEWNVGQGARSLKFGISHELATDLEPGNHVEIQIQAANNGKNTEGGVFQLALPQGIRISSPETNKNRTFMWQLEPGESVRQSVVLQIEPQFDAAALWHLNYGSVPVSAEVYWQQNRALITTSIPMAVPVPHSS